jgi:hypothetical protein
LTLFLKLSENPTGYPGLKAPVPNPPYSWFPHQFLSNSVSNHFFRHWWEKCSSRENCSLNLLKCASFQFDISQCDFKHECCVPPFKRMNMNS